DIDGFTPLHWACRNGREEIVKLLLSTGKVDINARDDLGNTPFHLAIQGRHEEMAKLLLSTGKVDINARNEHGTTALCKA
ncbi:ankyrin repeat-containing domain protein, partial [Chaetomium sp. MPI-SDFR-AT-0129]